MSPTIIETSAACIHMEGISFRYGKIEALQGLNLEVPRGSVCGLLGRNGAGKTTAIKILAGLMLPDAGKVRVLGKHPWLFQPADRERMTYLSDQQNLPPHFKVSELMDYCRQWYPKWDREMERRLISQFQLDQGRKVKDLSMGGQRKVALILALAPRPDLILMDEPAGGLDPVVRREFLEEILEIIRGEGRTVLFSSHILSDVERVADRVAIISKGRLLLQEPIDQLQETIRQVRFFGFQDPTSKWVVPGAFAIRWSKGDALVTLRLDRPSMLEELSARYRCQVQVLPLALEDLFIELVREEGRE